MKIAEVSKKYDIPQETLRYYERANVIPSISRDAGGIRNYSEEDCKWIEQAKCLRSAGLSVESIAEYRRLFIIGDSTFSERCELLKNEREKLIAQRKSIDDAIERLDFKIGRYEIAVKTGTLSWESCDKQ